MFWLGFAVLIFCSLAVDLGLFRRKPKSGTLRESLAWVLIWITLAMLFDAVIWMHHGPQKSLEFLTGYVIEISLSMDNVFVFISIFAFFAVPATSQHKILFWGILGAMILRGLMIAVGCALVAKFSWIFYIFGGFLILTGIKMALTRGEEIEPDRNPVVRFFRRLLPITDGHRGAKFFVRENGRLMATPIFLVLAVVEASDVVFAVDSVPAIFSITTDPFIVFTSNIFAILGLRSLYFVLARAADKFHLLHYGLGAVLVFVGAKMLLERTAYRIETLPSLAVVGVILAVSVIASLMMAEE